MSVSDFSVLPAQVADAARTYSGYQQTAPDLGNEVQATGVVDTGDPELNSLVQQTMDGLAQVCVQIGKAMSTTAAALNEVADGYQSTDATVTSLYSSLMSGGGGTNVPMM